MASHKRADFWDVPSSEEDENDVGYDSEEVEKSKGRSNKSRATGASSALRRPAKRRKLFSRQSETLSDYQAESSDDDVDKYGEPDVQIQPTQPGEPTESTNKLTPLALISATPAISTQDAPSIRTRKAKSKKNKTGVVYLSSLPPYLKPSALKSLLMARGFSPITKVFLTPSVRSSSGGHGKRSNKRRMYSDGWIEFASKRTAKICAEALNATIVGGKKGGWYHDDVWNLKYLRGFKWADLMEQVQREKREAEARRMMEDSKARKEEKVFLAGVERGKMVEGIRKKREEKAKKKGDADTPAVDKPRRLFRQNEVREREMDSSGKERRVDADVQRVLSKIF
ncbi:RNA-binding ATPase activator esf2 [Ophidiomyces ophidiicola]|nr:RNA-binding ATPase activator esf2 [Ophidiomyces ophidiicola]